MFCNIPSRRNPHTWFVFDVFHEISQSFRSAWFAHDPRMHRYIHHFATFAIKHVKCAFQIALVCLTSRGRETRRHVELSVVAVIVVRHNKHSFALLLGHSSLPRKVNPIGNIIVVCLRGVEQLVADLFQNNWDQRMSLRRSSAKIETHRHFSSSFIQSKPGIFDVLFVFVNTVVPNFEPSQS